MNCDDARTTITHRGSGALEPAVATDLERHLSDCPTCARSAEIEAGFERALRRRLPRAAAPPGLETRLRAALRAEALRAADGARPFGRRWAALFAAAALLAVVMSPVLMVGGGLPGAAGTPFSRVMMVVDRQCDAMGVPPAVQHRCRHRGHVNALKASADSDVYLAIGLDGAAGRRVLADPNLRGETLRIEGRLAPDGASVAIERVAPAAAEVSATVGAATTPFG